MQAYALQIKLRENENHQALTTDMAEPILLKKAASWAKYFVLKLLGRKGVLPRTFNASCGKNNQLFIQKYIKTTSQKEAMNQRFLDNIDFLIVGSDQVWRQAYVPVDKYMFSFVKDDSIPRISYAASFGRDDLDEYSPKLIKKTAKLAKKFKAISVREKSGIKLAKEHWGVKANCHVDPTLLFDAEHYNKLIDEDAKNLLENDGKIFAYVLDREGEKGKIINKVASELKTKVFEVLPPKPKTYREYKKNPEKYNLPPVTQWLKAFRDADFVVTDSFHGCVFSIIYNKPFLAIGNKKRGLTRFASLLSLFKLDNRLVSGETEATKELINTKINWQKVNSIIKTERLRSEKYLWESLSE